MYVMVSILGIHPRYPSSLGRLAGLYFFIKSKKIAKKKEINTRDSHLVPHGSTKRASSDLASKFGMGFGALHSL